MGQQGVSVWAFMPTKCTSVALASLLQQPFHGRLAFWKRHTSDLPGVSYELWRGNGTTLCIQTLAILRIFPFSKKGPECRWMVTFWGFLIPLWWMAHALLPLTSFVHVNSFTRSFWVHICRSRKSSFLLNVCRKVSSTSKADTGIKVQHRTSKSKRIGSHCFSVNNVWAIGEKVQIVDEISCIFHPNALQIKACFFGGDFCGVCVYFPPIFRISEVSRCRSVSHVKRERYRKAVDCSI